MVIGKIDNGFFVFVLGKYFGYLAEAFSGNDDPAGTGGLEKLRFLI